MERDSIVYRLRRKIQAIAYYILPHDVLSKIYFKLYLHQDMNLSNPKKFNEKLQWLKLNYNAENALVVQCTDKYLVRSHIEKCGYGKTLTKLLGVWDKAEDIEWDKLPNQFVLKCNHGCAYNIICKDKNNFDIEVATKKLNGWLKENFAAFNVELHYEKIEHRRIICEEYLGDVITDYKFFCFNGEPKFFYVSKDLVHDRQAEIGFFNMDGSKLPMIRKDYKDIEEINFPSFFSEMVEISSDLSKAFPFVRVDFFITENYFKFAELTFTPGACMMPLDPPKYDVEWGNMLQLPMK